jgi:hypothetical protein
LSFIPFLSAFVFPFLSLLVITGSFPAVIILSLTTLSLHSSLYFSAFLCCF